VAPRSLTERARETVKEQRRALVEFARAGKREGALTALAPRKTRTTTRRQRGQMILLGLASIYEGLLEVCSLGYLTTDLGSWLLFEYFEE
jgi:hypothetical protein